MTHFKTQQEIWKYVADGGVVINDEGKKVKFVNGVLNGDWVFCTIFDWSPYIEPVPKTKVWRWEKVETSSTGRPSIYQTSELYTEEDAAKFKSGYTKVAGSEREI